MDTSSFPDEAPVLALILSGSFQAPEPGIRDTDLATIFWHGIKAFGFDPYIHSKRFATIIFQYFVILFNNV